MSTTEKYFIDKDIKVACVKASSFPQGFEEAFQKLHSILPSSQKRTLYGISPGGKNGNIIYRAAAEELHEGEAEELGLERFIIRKGGYISELLKDFDYHLIRNSAIIKLLVLLLVKIFLQCF